MLHFLLLNTLTKVWHCISPTYLNHYNHHHHLCVHYHSMGRPPCCDKSNVKRGLWTAEEDAKILAYVSNYGIGNWTLAPKRAGLNRCGKSCRLRWTNYLRPDLKHESFTPQEEELIIDLHKAVGSRWSLIAKRLPGRTDNDVKNYWNTKLSKKLKKMGIDPVTHKPFSQILSDYGSISGLRNPSNSVVSFGKNFRNTLISQPESSSSSVLIGISSDKMMIMKPNVEQVQDNNSSTTNNPSLNFVADQFQNTIIHPHFFNEVTSSSSSSSSTNFRQLIPRPQISQPQITPTTSTFSWSEFLLTDPSLPADFPQQQYQQEFQGIILSSVSSSTLIENEISQCKSNNENDRIVGDQGSGQHNYGDSTKINRLNYWVDASSSSAGSFVDAILDRDSEIRSQFPELLIVSLDY